MKYESTQEYENAFLVAIKDETTDAAEAQSLLTELSSLADTLEIVVVGSIVATLREKNAATLLGTGKMAEIIASAKTNNAGSIIFDKALSPIQQRNWEKESGLSVYDRQELIIRIFASRAMTKEAALQVELARLNYVLPRLAHSYVELNRQRGGRYGTKGAGEQKIELDRRQISIKISNIEDELKVVMKARATQKKRREKMDIKRAAIIGYTNAGKSSILNMLAPKADVLAEDKLFATLDPTTRRLSTRSGSILISDTVGFIRNLPHGLIKAFKATLEEATQADLLIHVIDVSDPEHDKHYKATMSVLEEISAASIPTIIVYNKVDKLRDNVSPTNGIIVSAKTGEGMEHLRAAIEEAITKDEAELTLHIPMDKYPTVSWLYRNTYILSESHTDDYVIVKCRISQHLISNVKDFVI